MQVKESAYSYQVANIKNILLPCIVCGAIHSPCLLGHNKQRFISLVQIECSRKRAMWHSLKPWLLLSSQTLLLGNYTEQLSGKHIQMGECLDRNTSWGDRKLSYTVMLGAAAAALPFGNFFPCLGVFHVILVLAFLATLRIFIAQAWVIQLASIMLSIFTVLDTAKIDF